MIPSGVVPIPVTPSGVDPLQATDYSLTFPRPGSRGAYRDPSDTADRPGRIIPLNYKDLPDYKNLENSDPAEVTVSDLSHLPRTPGEPGAPVLKSPVTKVTDNSVTLEVSGLAAGSAVQYRYWSYYGLRDPSESGRDLLEVAPTEFRVPFAALADSGLVVIDPPDLRGIFSFQVRSVGADGVSLGNSNILHQMIGMAGFHTISPRLIPQPFILSLPTVVPLPTIQPPSFPSPHGCSQLGDSPSSPGGGADPARQALHPGGAAGQRREHGGADAGGELCGHGEVSLVAPQRGPSHRRF